MIDEATLERRLADLEQAVAEVRLGLSGSRPADDWLEILAGSISDESAFLKALEFGRAIRQTDRYENPPNEAGGGP